MSISTNSTDILESGVVISFKDEPIKFLLQNDLKITFTFFTDKEHKTHELKFKSVNSKEVEIQLYNFNNSLGTGSTEPLLLGHINKRKLYLNFVVYSLPGDLQKNLNYTFYLGEEVTNA